MTNVPRADSQKAFACRMLAGLGFDGLTVAELRQDPRFNDHHGSASGVLSNLHKAGTIARLSEKRDGCKVYVLPIYVGGRTTERYGRGRTPVEPCACGATGADTVPAAA